MICSIKRKKKIFPFSIQYKGYKMLMILYHAEAVPQNWTKCLFIQPFELFHIHVGFIRSNEIARFIIDGSDVIFKVF